MGKGSKGKKHTGDRPYNALAMLKVVDDKNKSLLDRPYNALAMLKVVDDKNKSLFTKMQNKITDLTNALNTVAKKDETRKKRRKYWSQQTRQKRRGFRELEKQNTNLQKQIADLQQQNRELRGELEVMAMYVRERACILCGGDMKCKTCGTNP
jgi:septal ring factor EnvC (AmiA/AmiB activator)